MLNQANTEQMLFSFLFCDFFLSEGKNYRKPKLKSSVVLYFGFMLFFFLICRPLICEQLKRAKW